MNRSRVPMGRRGGGGTSLHRWQRRKLLTGSTGTVRGARAGVGVGVGVAAYTGNSGRLARGTTLGTPTTLAAATPPAPSATPPARVAAPAPEAAALDAGGLDGAPPAARARGCEVLVTRCAIALCGNRAVDAGQQAHRLGVRRADGGADLAPDEDGVGCELGGAIDLDGGVRAPRDGELRGRVHDRRGDLRGGAGDRQAARQVDRRNAVRHREVRVQRRALLQEAEDVRDARVHQRDVRPGHLRLAQQRRGGQERVPTRSARRPRRATASRSASSGPRSPSRCRR